MTTYCNLVNGSREVYAIKFSAWFCILFNTFSLVAYLFFRLTEWYSVGKKIEKWLNSVAPQKLQLYMVTRSVLLSTLLIRLL